MVVFVVDEKMMEEELKTPDTKGAIEGFLHGAAGFLYNHRLAVAGVVGGTALVAGAFYADHSYHGNDAKPAVMDSTFCSPHAEEIMLDVHGHPDPANTVYIGPCELSGYTGAGYLFGHKVAEDSTQ